MIITAVKLGRYKGMTLKIITTLCNICIVTDNANNNYVILMIPFFPLYIVFLIVLLTNLS